MATRTIETDYLVVGSGAAGMAFTDSLISASDAQVVMVDRRHAPGGHWNDAYPFVRLRSCPTAFAPRRQRARFLRFLDFACAAAAWTMVRAVDTSLVHGLSPSHPALWIAPLRRREGRISRAQPTRRVTPRPRAPLLNLAPADELECGKAIQSRSEHIASSDRRHTS
jgi:choline dehydrogenase-like flavoprotein